MEEQIKLLFKSAEEVCTAWDYPEGVNEKESRAENMVKLEKVVTNLKKSVADIKTTMDVYS